VKRAALILTILIPFPSFAQGVNQLQNPPGGNPTREFVMSCTYGVLAGTLVGAASLAFADRPSDKMHRVARGASLGLYTGILLGLYVVYIVPGMENSEEEEEDPVARAERLPFLISPRFEENKLAGADLLVNVLRF
jgi:hypothetical protein